MQVLRLNNFGFSGTNSDLDSASNEPSIFSEGSNFRCIDDKIVSYNGKSQLLPTPTGIAAGMLFCVKLPTAIYYVLLGSTSCKVCDGTTWYDITPTGLAAASVNQYAWTATMLGNIPVFNNPGFYPVYWSPQNTTQVLLPLLFKTGFSWQAMAYHANSVRAHKNFLFAINTNEGGVDYSYSYRWSHPADINGLPPSWDDTNLAYIASKQQVNGNGGGLVEGCSLRDAFCLYSKNSITVLDYYGDEYVWHARELSSSFGILSGGMVTEFMGMNAFITDGDILINDGTSIKSVLASKLRRRFAANINDEFYTRCFVTHIPNKTEVWFCIIEEGYTYPNIVYIYNYTTGTISLRDLPGISSVAYGPLVAITDTYDGAADAGLTMDSDSNPSNMPDYFPFNFRALGLDPITSIVYSLDDIGGNALNTSLTRTNFVFNELDDATTILAMYPKIKSIGSVAIQIGSQQHYDGPVNWKQPITFTPNIDRRVALRSTGKLHAWRISSIGSTPFSMSGMDIEYKPAGAR